MQTTQNPVKSSYLARYSAARANLWAGIPKSSLKPAKTPRKAKAVMTPHNYKDHILKYYEKIIADDDYDYKRKLAMQIKARNKASEFIRDNCYDYLGYLWPEIVSKRRFNRLARARQVVCWLLYTYTNLSYPEIGRKIKRDHTTVMHGVSAVNAHLTGIKCNKGYPIYDFSEILNPINTKMESMFPKQR